MAESENDSNDSNGIEMDLDDLTEDQKQAILQNPDVRKSLRYELDSVSDSYEGLEDLAEAEEDSEEGEAYDLLVTGIAERSGRVTEKTVNKVLNGFVEEVAEFNDSD